MQPPHNFAGVVAFFYAQVPLILFFITNFATF